ncbi:MAG: protein translocase subunit SecD [Nocardioidaceae bacterium]|nr:protein translocase subunit SecD [Nocardioidaceae bacterium]
MASRKPRPGRHLIYFFLGIAVAYGLVALAGSWQPTLGLDLQGGTRVTLTTDKAQSKDNLAEARRIIDQRVNGSGIAEAAVTTQGNKNIVVEVPGEETDGDQLENTVKRQAQLRFRLVACAESQGGGPCAAGTGLPGLGRAPLSLAEDDPTDTATDQPGSKAGKSGNKSGNQAGNQAGPSTAPTDQPTGQPGDAPAESPGDQPGAEDKKEWTVQDNMAWADQPDQKSIQQYNAYTCQVTKQNGEAVAVLTDANGKPADLPDDPDLPLVACSTPDSGASEKTLLSRSIIEGTELDDASAQQPSQGIGWEVAISMSNDKDRARPKGSPGAATDFEVVSRAYAGNDSKRFAIVLDGEVLSAPTMTAVITDGKSSITGNFNEQSALDLANSLKFGALPIKFNDDKISVEEIGPSLAGNQLTAGLTAGAIGLVLVMLYCLLYYRGLGLVVVSSLFVAAAITYAMVLLLSETAGFTLTLPGIAGLIIAVGITADSFVIFFERIRDEMREGKSMRVAVETGWARARVTRVAANTVQVLSAVVLYTFATGAVKGFGFALGLSVAIDLAVLFWFTKPMVSWLAQFKFFNSGSKFSGLSKTTLGMDGPRPARAGTVGGDA